MRKILPALSILLTVVPFIWLGVAYDAIPEQVPAYVDLKGNPTLMMDKSLFSVFRLPLMGLMLQILCFTMLSLPLKEGGQKNTDLWLSVSLLAAVKMSLTSVEVLIFTNPNLLETVRTGVLIVILAAVVFILINALGIYKMYKERFGQYLSGISLWQKSFLFFSIIGYVGLAMLPQLIR